MNTLTFTPCPSPEQLAAWVDHGLPYHEMFAVESHLVHCLVCRQVVWGTAEQIQREADRIVPLSPALRLAIGKRAQQGMAAADRDRANLELLEGWQWKVSIGLGLLALAWVLR